MPHGALENPTGKTDEQTGISVQCDGCQLTGDHILAIISGFLYKFDKSGKRKDQ